MLAVPDPVGDHLAQLEGPEDNQHQDTTGHPNSKSCHDTVLEELR